MEVDVVEHLFKRATIYPITSEPFVGDVLVKDGKIAAIAEKLDDPNAEIVDLTGKYLFPGFVDAHSHIGIMEESVGTFYYQDGNEMTEPVTAQVSVVDAFNPDDAAIDRALAGGVTTVMVVPGSANPVGGQGAIFKFRSKIVDEMLVRAPAGLKMALGENPKRVYGSANKQPSTRLGNAAIIRAYFTKVKNYMAKKEAAEKEGKPFAEQDLAMEVGELVLKRKIPARIHAHRKDDILTAIRLSEEFGFDLVIEHGTEGYLIADYIRSKGVPLVIGPLLSFRSKVELKNLSYESVRILNEAGVLTALMCDHPVIHLEHTAVQAAVALRYGARESDILRMLTINPAQILGLEAEIGSIEPGKNADLVVWSDHPFDMRAKVERVYIDGKEVLPG
ncbi:MAG: amidohydrolase [Thermotogae bacterium]|nr:amidohydrolase [Thermotogota bacterium]